MSAPCIHPEVAALREQTIEDRRWFHQYPELGYEEHITAARIAKILRDRIGLTEVFEGVGRTGVVALIRGEAGPGPCVALRADIDALPILETSDIPYVSRHPGKAHMCGHDGHIAGLLCAAQVINAGKGRLKGVVKLFFQPAEEGLGGALEMIKEGVLEDGAMGPRVDEVYGIHLWSYNKLGEIGVKDGPIMAASDRLVINCKGKGGHGAQPQGTVDAIVMASHLVCTLQTVVSRNKDPLDPAVITIGQIKGGSGFNIISDNCELIGTCRTFTDGAKDMIVERMQGCCSGIAATFGGEIALDYQHGFPATVNRWPDAVDRVRRAAGATVPASKIVPVVTMAAEDFSYFLIERPGAFFFVGAGLEGELRPHHKAIFDFDEEALSISATCFVRIIDEILGATA